MKRAMPLYNGWVQWDTESGDYVWPGNVKHPESGTFKKQDLKDLEWYHADYKDNRLAYFLPHGVPWSAEPKLYDEGRITLDASDYPEEWRNDGVAFINDMDNPFCCLVAPRKTGKSAAGVAKLMLNGFLKTDPEWHCYQYHNISYVEYEGPKNLLVGSFSWFNVGELFKVYQEFLPRRELGQYAEDWGEREGERGMAKKMSFGDNRPKHIKMVESKSPFTFLCYSQSQQTWENFKSNGLHADEQIPMSLLRAWEDGTRTMGDWTPAVFTLSGFCLPERPDTGAAGPIKRNLYDGRDTHGKTVGKYHLDVPSTPDAIVTKKKKQEAYDQYVNPDIERDDKTDRRGKAVYWPGWEESGGLMLDEWSRRIHVVPPLWTDDTIPVEATLFRALDHGESAPTACTWMALVPARNPFCDYSFAVIYRLFYQRNVRIAESAPRIIEMSGNERVKIGEETDEIAQATFSRFEERSQRERYVSTIMDSRSAAYRKDGVPLGVLYERYGLACASAPGGKIISTPAVRGQIEWLRDWLRIDKTKKHVVTGELGAPRLYVFDTPELRPLVDEIEQWASDPDDPSRPQKGMAEHAIKTLIYTFSTQPVPEGAPPKERGVREKETDSEDRFGVYGEVLTGG